MTTSKQTEYRPDYVSPPGETLLEALEERGMTQAQLAERAGRPKKTINEIVKGKAAITPDTAIQLERVLGIPASFWNRREQQYREFLARQADERRLKSWKDWLKELPIKEMAQRGWIPADADKIQQVLEALKFFGVASPEAWRAIVEQEVVAYRQSTAVANSIGAIAAWLRQGEIAASVIECAPYDEQAFRQVVKRIRAMALEPPERVLQKMVELCASAGVALVIVPALRQMGTWGATRWVTPQKALLQLSLHYKTDDHFWFTFFHEAGHILLHGKRETFLDEGSEEGVKEEEANQFAGNTLVPQRDWVWFINSERHFGKADIFQFAQEVGVAPGVIVGRLQHEKLLRPDWCNDLKRRVQWSDEEEGGKTGE